jgi:mannosyl-oligosaccharide glucosidase
LTTVLASELTKGLAKASSAFAERFKAAFTPKPPFHTSLYITFLQSTLSNLLGNIGYFYGDSQADLSQPSEYEEKDPNFWEKVAEARTKAEPTFSDLHELFSTVPSRASFPRGFLWDEGFHLLSILEWDLDLTMEIVQSWLGLMNDDGWIAREQILGSEARSRVPPEFRTQYPQHANPPTLFMVVSAFTDIISGNKTYNGHPSRYLAEPSLGPDYLKSVYQLLGRYYKWFRKTQAGDMESYNRSTYAEEGYRWRGRTPNHTLSSGLDDYPRAEPPHSGELHVDALSWVGIMARVLKQISEHLGETDDHLLYLNHEKAIVQSIEALHWSEEHQVYCDATIQDEAHTLICHKGYISLYPFFLGFMEPAHPHLHPLLDLVENKTELWSEHGIQSLSKQDEHYETDENYWRSPVWININFLILQQLLVLAQGQGPHRDQAREIYIALRKNLVTTVYDSWRQTGFIWENYASDTGLGGGAFQFTGWTALIVKVAAMPDLRKRGIHTIVESTPDWSSNSHLLVSTAVLVVFLFMFRRRTARIWTSVFSK